MSKFCLFFFNVQQIAEIAPLGEWSFEIFFYLHELTLGGEDMSKSLFSFAWVGGSDAHGHVDVDRAVSSR